MFLKRANSSFRTRRSCSGVNCTQLLSLEGKGKGGRKGRMSVLKCGDAGDQPHPQAFFRSEFQGKCAVKKQLLSRRRPMDEASC